MSSYFDGMARAVREAGDHEPSDEEFLASVVAIEHQMFREITYVTGDREFPDDLREKMLGAFAVESVYQPGRLPMPEKAREYVLMMRCSRVLDSLHELFHDLARRRIETRFGWLSDSPTGIAVLRDDHDNPEAEEEN
jgi:hypothetical protein